MKVAVKPALSYKSFKTMGLICMCSWSSPREGLMKLFANFPV